MAERKAVNKYYPPDWTPDQGSLNKYHGTHALRERARKLSEGILIIRFELPYNIWCGGCGNHVGMGVRYNAQKKKVGNYYSTPIYRFRMKCHLCDNHFEIETDPKNCDYVIVSGARRKEERWEPSATETIETTDREDAKNLAEDAMFKLEHGVEDVKKLKAAVPGLEQLQDVQTVWKDDYAANQAVRKRFREEKKELKLAETKDNELKARGALEISLLPEKPEDIDLAKSIRYKNEGFEAHRRKRRLDIKSRPLFDRKVDTKDQRGNLNELFRKRRKMELPSSKSQRQDKEAVATKFGVISRRRKAESEGTSCSQQRPDHATTNGEVHGETRGLCEMSRGAALSIQKNYNRPGGSSCKEVECEEKDSSTMQFDKLNSFAVGKSMSVSLVSCEYTESGDSSSEQ